MGQENLGKWIKEVNSLWGKKVCSQFKGEPSATLMALWGLLVLLEMKERSSC